MPQRPQTKAGALANHAKSWLLGRSDNGWVHTLAAEAECTRAHYCERAGPCSPICSPAPMPCCQVGWPGGQQVGWQQKTSYSVNRHFAAASAPKLRPARIQAT